VKATAAMANTATGFTRSVNLGVALVIIVLTRLAAVILVTNAIAIQSVQMELSA
jgi:hypothetical protein